MFFSRANRRRAANKGHESSCAVASYIYCRFMTWSRQYGIAQSYDPSIAKTDPWRCRHAKFDCCGRCFTSRSWSPYRYQESQWERGPPLMKEKVFLYTIHDKQRAKEYLSLKNTLHFSICLFFGTSVESSVTPLSRNASHRLLDTPWVYNPCFQ